MSGQFHEVGVVTDALVAENDDVCCGDLVPEVELVSLVTEQLPRYRLRADTMTEFSGYHNLDWDPDSSEGPGLAGGSASGPDLQRSMAAMEEEVQGLTPEQIEHTLDYFILCGLRVSQMTKAYDDIGAVTQLLEEKERDLELAATIGRQLLVECEADKKQIKSLEEELREANEKVAQLRHDLALKKSLLKIYSDEANDAEDEFEDQSSRMSVSSSSSSISLTRVDLSHLRQKVEDLEAENLELKCRFDAVNMMTNEYEDKEQGLVKTCLQQLEDAAKRSRDLSDELTKKTDKCMQQQEDMTIALTKNVDLEGRIKQVLAENEFLTLRLRDSEQARQGVSAELKELRDKFDELLSMLAESQADARDLRKAQRRHTLRSAIPSPSGASSVCAGGDLASELALAERLGSEDAAEEEEDSSEEASRHSRRVMASVRHLRASRASTAASRRASQAPSLQDTSAAVRTAELLSSSGWEEEEATSMAPISSLATPSGSPDVIPGSTSFSPPPSGHRAAEKDWSAGSYLSTGSGQLEALDSASGIVHNWLTSAPDKLQIVKPLEGSETLRQWQHLATPSLSRALFDAPMVGVHVRGAPPSELEEEEEEDTAFSEIEEDDPPPADTSTSLVASYFSSPQVSSRLSRHKISGLSPNLARVLCDRGIPSQAAMAVISSQEAEEAPASPRPPPPPAGGHARLADIISRVGQRLWAGLLLSASATGAPLLSPPSPFTSPASSASSQDPVAPPGLAGCLITPRPLRRGPHRRVLQRTRPEDY